MDDTCDYSIRPIKMACTFQEKSEKHSAGFWLESKVTRITSMFCYRLRNIRYQFATFFIECFFPS